MRDVGHDLCVTRSNRPPLNMNSARSRDRKAISYVPAPLDLSNVAANSSTVSFTMGWPEKAPYSTQFASAG